MATIRRPVAYCPRMTRSRALAVGLVALALVLVLAGCGGDEDDAVDTTTTEVTETTETTSTEETTTETTDTGGGAGGTLSGTVGPGFDISMGTGGTVAPGSYELAVQDLSGAHNFHLLGPGVDVMTSVSGEGTETFSIDLQPGTYQFVCDPHASSMNGSFEVTGS